MKFTFITNKDSDKKILFNKCSKGYGKQTGSSPSTLICISNSKFIKLLHALLNNCDAMNVKVTY